MEQGMIDMAEKGRLGTILLCTDNKLRRFSQVMDALRNEW